MLLEELDEREHGVLDFFGHLEHFTESQAHVQESSCCIIAQFAVLLVNSALQGISGGGVDELLQPFGGDSI